MKTCKCNHSKTQIDRLNTNALHTSTSTYQILSTLQECNTLLGITLKHDEMLKNFQESEQNLFRLLVTTVGCENKFEEVPPVYLICLFIPINL